MLQEVANEIAAQTMKDLLKKDSNWFKDALKACGNLKQHIDKCSLCQARLRDRETPDQS